MLSQFLNMNPKVFNTHQEIWALMFQGVKYTVKSVQERFSVWTHTPRSWRSNQLISYGSAWEAALREKEVKLFLQSALLFLSSWGLLRPWWDSEEVTCSWTCVHNPVSSDVLWTAHSSIPFLCISVYRATLSGRVGLKHVSLMICCEFTFTSTGTVLKETKVYFSHLSDSPDAGPTSNPTSPLSCHRVCLVLLHFSVWNKKPSWKFVLTLVCHSGVKEQVGSVIWSVSCGILFLPDLQQLQLLLRLFCVPLGFGGKYLDLQWAEVAAKVTYS